MNTQPVSLTRLNDMDQRDFVAVVGSVFEHSPWIAQNTWIRRPFHSIALLHLALVDTVQHAPDARKLALIRAHPDLVGQMAKNGALTRESTVEQASAGLSALTSAEIAQFDLYNAEYRARFGFPFVICTRENKKQSILAAFPVRLKNSPMNEMETALKEIFKIAAIRLCDAIIEG